jgi:hypothetical protein
MPPSDNILARHVELLGHHVKDDLCRLAGACHLDTELPLELLFGVGVLQGLFPPGAGGEFNAQRSLWFGAFLSKSGVSPRLRQQIVDMVALFQITQVLNEGLRAQPRDFVEPDDRLVPSAEESDKQENSAFKFFRSAAKVSM